MIAGLAARQHGVVGRQQLLAAGLGSRAIEHRAGSGKLHPLYRGAYAVGHQVVSQQGRWMAATLSTGGVLSHRSAGALWGLRPWNGRIEVTTRWTRAERQGLLLHRAVLAEDEITIAPSSTSSVLQTHQLQQAINEAERLRLDRAQPERHPTTPSQTSRPRSTASSMTAVSRGLRPTSSSKGTRSTAPAPTDLERP